MELDNCANISIIVLACLLLVIILRNIFLINQENYLGDSVKVGSKKSKKSKKAKKSKKSKKKEPKEKCINESPFVSHAEMTTNYGTVIKLNNGFTFFWWDGNASAIFARNNLQPSTFVGDYRTTIFNKLKLDKGYKMRIWRWWPGYNSDIICPRPAETIGYEGDYRLDLLGPVDMYTQCTTGIHGVWVGKESDPFPDFPRSTYLGYSVSG